MKKIVSIILLLINLFSMTAIAFSDSVDGPSQKIKVGINVGFKPFEYYEDDELKGFDIDLMNYIGERIGFDIEFVDMPFEKLIPAVVSGEIICAISAITVTEQRDSIIDYSREYLKTESITFEDGQKSVKHGECYAIVFREGLANAPYRELITPTTDESLYILIDKALMDLSNDRTIMKLIEKYELNKPFNENGVNVEYSAIMSGGDPGAKILDEESKTSATSVPYSNWAKADIEKATALNIINYGGNYNYLAPITREEFCELIYNYCLNVVGQIETFDGENRFTDTNNPHILILNAMEIIKGKSETEFAPDDLLMREEAAVILNRMINKTIPVPVTEKYFIFDDEGNISDWASDAIQVMCNMKVMDGVGENKFAPQDTYTTEQAIATIVRVYAVQSANKGIHIFTTV